MNLCTVMGLINSIQQDTQVCINLKTIIDEVENSIQYYVERSIDYQDEVAKIIKATDAVKALVEENYTQLSHISKVASYRRNG